MCRRSTGRDRWEQRLSGFTGDRVAKEASIKRYLVTRRDTCETADSFRRPRCSEAQDCIFGGAPFSR